MYNSCLPFDFGDFVVDALCVVRNNVKMNAFALICLSFHVGSEQEKNKNPQKYRAPGEDRTHDLQIALLDMIMRLTRCLLRYRGHTFKGNK